MNPILVIVVVQLMFSFSDVIGRHMMTTTGFTPQSWFSGWFLLYFFIRNIAMFGQLYVFSKIELGHTMAIFGAVSIFVANGLGFLFFREVLTPQVYIGVTLSILAFVILALRA
jgi:multidrug transporter EmrE-like cation transporter